MGRTAGLARAGMAAGLVGLALCGGAAAFAKEEAAKPGPDMKDPGQSRTEFLNTALSLTDAQRTQVQQITEANQAKWQALKDQMAALRKEEHDKIRAVLTPEQQTTFDQMQEKKWKYGDGAHWHKPGPAHRDEAPAAQSAPSGASQ